MVETVENFECVCVCQPPRRGGTRTGQRTRKKMKWEASSSEAFEQKDTYCFVVFTGESNQFCILSLPHLRWLSHPQCFHLGVVVTRVLQICTVVCTLRWGGCPPHLNPSRGESPCFGGWMREGGRVMILFFFFSFFFFCWTCTGVSSLY